MLVSVIEEVYDKGGSIGKAHYYGTHVAWISNIFNGNQT